MTDLTAADWSRLHELRGDFLDAGERWPGLGLPDYWRDRRDLELYERTFAQRIAWKWLGVLRELAVRDRVPPPGSVLDWGCGTGIASRTYLAELGVTSARPLMLWDRSRAALEFAEEELQRAYPDVECARFTPGSSLSPDVLLVSHVINELSELDLAQLLELARSSRWIVWVESGAREISRRMSALRDGLLDLFEAVAPCTHSSSCGMLAEGQQSNWCHHFARPPAEVHQSRHWATFSRRMGIDLRSLPYAFIVMEKRERASVQKAPRTSRILGRPRILKGQARIDACDADGVHERVLLARESKSMYKLLDDCAGECLIYEWTLDGQRIRSPRRITPGAGG